MSIAHDLLVVTATIDPTVEADWNRWYNEIHVPEIVACPGFRSGQRYVAENKDGRSYVAIYELDGPEALESAEFSSRRGWGRFAGKVKWQTLRYKNIAQVMK